jgi:transketolase
MLASDNVEVDLLHCPCIKPFPAEDIIRSAQKTGCVVTVENQSIIGGLGGAAAEVLSENYPVEIQRLGIPDQFGEVVVEDKYIFDKHGFGPDHIMAACKKISGSK